MEAVTQLRAPAERESLTPLRRRSESFHNLPLQLTRFVGRESEQAELLQLLEVERLVTLTGTGGIGKSRLAVELSGSLIHSYRDGVWLVELASLQESDLVVQSISEQVGVRAETGTAEQALLEFLRGRQLLLVLDNCEHLIQACASITEAILRTCPAVQILATSREPLHIAGETSWRVPPLSVPDAARHASRQLLEAEAVRLFADRAQASAGLVVNAANAESVAKICQQLDGIPLAIELAAARARVLSVEQIASRLDNRFRLLIGGGRTAPLRQQTLRAAIDWSYELLSTAEQRMLGWLSVFAGGFTLEAAERACATESTPAEDVFDLLARLVDKSLVQAEPGSGGQLRYRLLESVRAYAHEQLLAGGDAAMAARRHCAYYAELAQQAEKHLLWGSGALDWLARLDREMPNLRAALAWSLSEGGEPGMALKLAGQLGHYWYTRADRAEGRAWLKCALAHAASGNSTDAAWALLWAGGLAHGQTDYENAAVLIAQALGAFERLDDPRGIGWALSFLGHIARARAELTRAATYLEQAIAAFRGIDDEISVILPLGALGFTVGMLGDQVLATRLLDDSVTIARKAGSNGRLAITSIYLGQVACMQGQTASAEAAFAEGLRLFQGWDSAWGMAECLEGLAVVAGLEGRFERAARLLGAAARLRESIGAPAHPVDRADHERTVAASLAGLGQSAYDAAWRAGLSMSLDDVISSAVAPETRREEGSLLTRREREVAVQRHPD